MSKRGKRRKANHLHFVPLRIKQDRKNPFLSQHERRPKAYCLVGVFFFPESQQCGFPALGERVSQMSDPTK